MDISDFVRKQRKLHRLTQVDLAEKAGVGLRFIRELERGKATLRMDKVNQVLHLFGKHLGAVDWRPLTEESKASRPKGPGFAYAP
ncbi:MAG: helix-turn-helix transcriptional regulator [Deltaproteobacteria bacterium]|nr:helix-turn-helix transcriptional regulator [Deltaproteobacteria bacterium]